MFASKSLVEHLLRGLVGLAALFAASSLIASSHPWLGLLLLPVAILALRGCPTCWLLGLVETGMALARGKSTAGLCTDGACVARRQPARSETVAAKSDAEQRANSAPSR